MFGDTYQDSGVNLDAMENLKDRIKAFAAMTHGPEVMDSGGSFAGVYRLAQYRQPVLVASTDGVGTKLKIAAQLGHFESIGQDLVTLNVNDVLTRGAQPIFFLDYVSFSDYDEHRMETLMRGMVWGCREVGCALIGGETAQMPGLYTGDDFDLAGFVVGVAEESEVLNGNGIVPGDVMLGFASSGLHTNGFSLVRRVFGSDENPSALYRRYPELNHNLGEELLIRHRCYYPLLAPILSMVKGLSHITGGGLPGKMPPILPDTVTARFELGSWPEPPIFGIIRREGRVEEEEMRRVFNLGLGMVAVCAPDQVDGIREVLPEAMVIGEIIPRQEGGPVSYG